MRIGTLLAFVVALAVPLGAGAVPVEIDILSGQEGAFRYSWLHTSEGAEMDGLYPAGTKTHALGGTLYGELTESRLIIHESTLEAVVLCTGEVLSLTLSGTLDLTQQAGGSLGFLHYTLDGESGAFDFYDELFMGGPANSITPEWLYLWGQNFERYQNPDYADWVTRGIDLGGRIRPVPEPSAALLFAAGGLLILAALRAREAAPSPAPRR